MTRKEIEEFLISVGSFQLYQNQYIYDVTPAASRMQFSIRGVCPAGIAGHDYGLFTAENLAHMLYNKIGHEKINGMAIEEYYDYVTNVADCSVNALDVL